MIIKFVKDYLTNIEWNNNKSEEWQVKGLLKDRLNEYLKFDIRHLSDYSNEKKGKLINDKCDSDKILFENKENWILIDTKELVEYMRRYKLNEIKIEEIINKLDWNIIFKK
jgi:hypothetical protein